MVDRQEQIRVQAVGGGDTPEQAGSRLAPGHEQPRLGKTFTLQFLLDPLCKAQIEDELRDVAGAHRAFRFSGMADIEDDREFRRIARICDRSQRRRVDAVRLQSGKLYRMGLWRGDMLWRFAVP